LQNIHRIILGVICCSSLLQKDTGSLITVAFPTADDVTDPMAVQVRSL